MPALPELIIGGVFREGTHHVSRIDDAVFMQPDKHAGVLCGAPWLERVGRAKAIVHKELNPL